MKRLVVCCDGTWKAESSSTVSNIIKIAQTIRFDAPGPAGEPIQQWVSYVSGPGARGFLADRLMGGAFGLGLEANLSSAYWHLALNWEPGDEIYIFGFSRGAFTARSLAGLIGRIGILTPEAMIEGKYPDALKIHHQPAPKKTPENPDPPDPQEWIDFRAKYCTHPVKINFLGVFDTVGALGVPGLTSLHYKFHDVKLGSNVHCARQALAINERRRAFEPCLWEVPIEPDVKYPRKYERVKQVWFEGVHSDIGGGYEEGGLSDITLRWMVTEAEAVGLAFDRERLRTLAEHCAADGSNCVQLHNSLGLGYRILNVLRAIRQPRNPRFYWDSWRRLASGEDRGIRLAATVEYAADYLPANLRRWLEDHEGKFPARLVEPITPPHPLPPASPDQQGNGQAGEELLQSSPALEGVSG
jgi:uncharacterized protein (DUF2235 family)